MVRVRIKNFGLLNIKSRKAVKLDKMVLIDPSDEVYDYLRGINIKQINTSSDMFDIDRIKTENTYYKNKENREYLKSLSNTAFWYIGLFQEERLVNIQEINKIPFADTQFYSFIRWFVDRSTTKNILCCVLESKYNTNILSGFVRLYANGNIDTTVGNVSIISISFDISKINNINKKTKEYDDVNDFYIYMNNNILDMYNTTYKVSYNDAISRIPERKIKYVDWTIRDKMKEYITLSKNDSEMSSKGGPDGYMRKNDTDKQKICQTCLFDGFDCPNHVTYIKSSVPMIDYAHLNIIINKDETTLNSLLSWIRTIYKKSYVINSFVSYEGSNDISDASKIILNGRVYSSTSGDSKSIFKETAPYEAKKALYDEMVNILSNIKLRKWSETYNILGIFKKSLVTYVPILPPRLYRTDIDDKNGLQGFFRKFMDNNKEVESVMRAIYSPGDNSKSIIDMLRDKHGYLESNLSVRRFDSARFILAGNTYIHPTETIISDYLASNLSFVMVVKRSNISLLSNLPIKAVYRNDIKIKTRKIKYGDKVHIPYIDGLFSAIVNRNPSLDESSLLATRLRVSHDRSNTSIRIANYAVVGFNGDFDGDEFNLFASTNFEHSDTFYNQMSIINKPLTTYERYAVMGLHMDSFLFLYIISSNKKFEFPIMDMSFDKSHEKNHLTNTNISKYVDPVIDTRSRTYVFKDRFVVDVEDLNDIHSNKHKLLKESYDKIDVSKYPFEIYRKTTYDTRVKYLKRCVGFVRMRGYDMIDHIFSSLDYKADRKHKYNKKDFKYNTDNLMTWFFRNRSSTLVCDWLWIVSNLASMFFTHNTQYATLKIDDVLNKDIDDIYESMVELENDIYYNGLGDGLLRKYTYSTAPDISEVDMIRRDEFFSMIEDKVNGILKDQQLPKDNQLYRQGDSGSKGDVKKFRNIYYTYGPMRNLGIILPNTLGKQVTCSDDYLDASRWGLIKNSLAEGLSPLEYYHQFNMVHIALQQTPLETKETGSIEKSLTPFVYGLYKDGDVIINETSEIVPSSYFPYF